MSWLQNVVKNLISQISDVFSEMKIEICNQN